VASLLVFNFRQSENLMTAGHKDEVPLSEKKYGAE